jgi:prepilin-type N-terminal cleavage/methylation domain-containing protein
MNCTTKQRRDGFTIVELLVVIGIILVVVSLLIPVVNAAKRQAYRARAAHDIQAICMAIESYHRDMGYYPSVTTTGLNGTGIGNQTSDGNGDSRGAGSSGPNDELYRALFCQFSGYDGGRYGPYISPGAFFVDPSGSARVYDHNGKRFFYVPARKSGDYTAPPTTVWDPYLNKTFGNSGQFADTIGNPLWRITMQDNSYTTTIMPNAGVFCTNMPFEDWRYILGNRYHYGDPSSWTELDPVTGATVTVTGTDGTCQASHGDVPATTGPYIIWCSGPSKNDAGYGATGYRFGLLRDRKGNLVGTAPSMANGWHGYSTDDIMNFTP